VLGLTRETTAAHLLKGCLEGVTLRMNAIIQRIRTVISKTQATTDMAADEEEEEEDSNNNNLHIICSGKALEANDLWRQMLADCSGLDVVLDRETQEGTSRGVAKLVYMALMESAVEKNGKPRDDYEIETVEDSVTASPCKRAQQYWNQASLKQDRFIDAVFPLYKE
jgi:glycerol kinase